MTIQDLNQFKNILNYLKMKSKPKLEVRIFLTKRDIVAGDMKSYYVWQQVIEAMQEYADLYHKEKLRSELSDAFHYGRNTTISFKDYLKTT